VASSQRRTVDREAIEQSFATSGWELDASFSEHLIIGHNGDGLSILAHPQAGETEDTLFELIDHDRNLTYGVQEIPPPQQAALLLQEHGQPPE
jgi:ABC-type antimicrobial peptide transport system ATPase subunit